MKQPVVFRRNTFITPDGGLFETPGMISPESIELLTLLIMDHRHFAHSPVFFSLYKYEIYSASQGQ